MQLIVFLGLLVGTALAATTVNHRNFTVYSLREDVSYGPAQAPQPSLYGSFIAKHPKDERAVHMPNGMQDMERYPDYVQALLADPENKTILMLAYPWQLPRNIIDRISALDIVASAGHGQVGIPQLAQLAAELSTQPILLVQNRANDQFVRQEQLFEVGTVQITHEGKVQIIRDVVVERLQDPKYGAFFNPYGFNFQGSNNAYPFNYGFTLPYFAFQSQYPGYGYQGAYPSFTFQGQYPYSGYQGQYPYHGFQGQYPSYTFQAQYPFHVPQGQHPSYGYQGQYYNYGPAEKMSPTFPGYGQIVGYNFPGYVAPYFIPAILGNPSLSLGYNYVPSPYYPTANPFYIYGQKTPQEEATKAYSGYQYGSYPPFSFYAQQPQYQHGYQYQGSPLSYYQAYPFNQPGAKSYVYTPYQFQQYQYQPYHFQQYQPFQYQYYQNYQPFNGQFYPQ